MNATITAERGTLGRPETDGTHPQEAVEVLVGIPAYNEEIGIGSVVLAAADHADRVLVVDDGSTDRTARIARRAGATVIRHDSNRGKGAAIRSIFEFAGEIDCSVLVVLDGDGQHLPGQIPSVASPIVEERADVVIGNRHDMEGGDRETPLYRQIGQRTLDWFTQFSTGATVRDTQSGFRAFSTDAIESITPETDGMGVESEIIHAAMSNGLRIEEVPIDVRYQGIDGQTHNPIYHGAVVGLRILTLSRRGGLLVGGGIVALLLGLRRFWLPLVRMSGRRPTWRVGVLLGLGFGLILSIVPSRLFTQSRGER